MKKNILLIVTILMFIGHCSAYIENDVFCIIGKNSITVTMEKAGNYKCSEYLKVISQTVNKEYNDILSLQKLIEQGYDTEFWKEIREEKRSQIKKILAIKGEIEKALKEFDKNMFYKIKEYLIYSTATDRINYKKVLRYIGNIEKKGGYIDYKSKEKIKKMEELVIIIDEINSATDFETLMNKFNKYLYLKKQFTGK